ncbi:Site-specific recombinase XerD [Halobacillus alkaliphilus]|uniref:Site-specific recombinase XerD n=1 Tax=Halobacillus alkaliphilus TaxID=396056 RepID=A0A1I2MBV3_9BACI|nr:tyrosine-type recombinase/integrase [Halobacillus alkaliphilus]SFF88974.1 Site-specific recombinase XerD [Halobacillus alkaliphilus]
MAYIRKRGNKWSYQVEWFDSITGKRKTKSKGGFNRKTDARIEAEELEREVREDSYVEENNITLNEFADKWLNFYAKNSKISSHRGRTKELKHLRRYFSKMKLSDVTRKHYQAFLDDLHEKGYAHNTLDGIHTTGRMLFKKALEYNLIKTNPSEFAKIPKKIETVEEIEQNEEVIKFLEKNELITFLKTAKIQGLDRDFIMFLTLAYSGLRVGEMLALKWPDVNFDNETIRITKTCYNPNNNTKDYQLLTPKTKGSIRTIKMDKQVMSEFKKHLTHQNEIKMSLGDHYNDFGFVFAKEINNPGYPDFIKTIENRMKRLLKLSGLEKKVTPHSFRHTHTSLLIEAGVGTKEIQQRLGHGDINTTMNIYAHITKNMEQKASDKFNQLMKGLLD